MQVPYDTTSAVTRPTPARVRPMARAAPVERSSTRPRMNGPRSLTVTMTLWPPWVTRSLVPNGSERRSEERRVGKSVDLGGRRIIKKKKKKKIKNVILERIEMYQYIGVLKNYCGL